MIEGSGYSVTTTNDACLPFGNVAASKEGRALSAPSSTTDRTISSSGSRVDESQLVRFSPVIWPVSVASAKRIEGENSALAMTLIA